MQAQPISAHSGTPEVAALLLSLFATDELTVFLHELPDGPTFAAKLPSGSASAHQRAWNTVQLLERTGRLDATFWTRLAAARPWRAADIEAVRAAYRPPSRILDTLAHLHHRWTPLLATFALLTFAGATYAIAGRPPQPIPQHVVTAPDPPQYAEAERALRLGNSAVAIQLLQQLTVSAPTFDRGRAHLVSLLLIAGIVTQRTTLLEHIDRVAESPTYGEWAHCLIAQDLVDRPLLSTAELDVTCPRPVSIR